MYLFSRSTVVPLFLSRCKSCLINHHGLKIHTYQAKSTTSSAGSFKDKKSVEEVVDYSQVVFRMAESRDHAEVKVLCKGALGGRDVLPARFLHYLKDPLRGHIVAVYKGKLVAMIGGRITDDGNTMEGGSGRALPGLPGLFNLLRAHFVENWMKRKYPRVNTFRGVVRNEKTAFESPNVCDVPVIRDIVDLAWKVPVTALTKAIDNYQRNFQTHIEHHTIVQRIDKDQLSLLLDDIAFRERFIPSNLIIVDSSPFHLNYKSNLDIIGDDHDRNMFASYSRGHQVEALSFGTAIEMDVTMETLRYVIDYYGVPSLDSLLVHTLKHISTIPALLEQSQTAKDVYVAIFLTEKTVDESILLQFVDYMCVKLGLDNRNIKVPSDRQFILTLNR